MYRRDNPPQPRYVYLDQHAHYNINQIGDTWGGVDFGSMHIRHMCLLKTASGSLPRHPGTSGLEQSTSPIPGAYYATAPVHSEGVLVHNHQHSAHQLTVTHMPLVVIKNIKEEEKAGAQHPACLFTTTMATTTTIHSLAEKVKRKAEKSAASTQLGLSTTTQNRKKEEEKERPSTWDVCSPPLTTTNHH